MITIKDVQEYGKGIEEIVTIEEEGQTLTLKINQDTMEDIAKKYKHVGEQFGETGIAYAYTNLINRNYQVMWEIAALLEPELTEGTKTLMYEMKRDNEELLNKLDDKINEFAERMLEAGRPPQKREVTTGRSRKPEKPHREEVDEPQETLEEDWQDMLQMFESVEEDTEIELTQYTTQEMKKTLYDEGDEIILRQNIKEGTHCGGVDYSGNHAGGENRTLTIATININEGGKYYYTTEELGEDVHITDTMVDQIKTKAYKQWRQEDE